MLDVIEFGFVTAAVGAKSDQQVNICSFAMRCDRMWPSTQQHRIYTGSGNVSYVQFQSVGDFIPEPRCSKFMDDFIPESMKLTIYCDIYG